MLVKYLVFHSQKLSDKQCRRQLKRQKNKSVQIVQILRAIMVVSKESSLRALFLRGTVEPPYFFRTTVILIGSAFKEE